MSSQKIFISHSSSDRAWAHDFANAMRGLGADVWFDAFDIKPGDSISERLEEALRDSDVIVLPITQATLHNPNVFFELGAAIGMNKKIIPILAEDVDHSMLPPTLSRVRALRQGEPEETAKALAEALNISRDEAA